MKKRSLLLQMVVTLAVWWTASAGETSQRVALVNKDKIMVEELEAKLKQTGIKTSDPQELQLLKSQALSSLILDRLVAQKAVNYDFSSDTLFQREKYDHMMSWVFRKMYQKYVSDLVRVTPEEVEKQYYDNKETLYKIPEQVRVSHILIEPEEDPKIENAEKRKKEADQKALQKTLEVKKRAETEDFAALAEKFSRDFSTGPRGGDMGYKKRGQMLPEFDSAAFAADTGQIIGPLKSKFGFHIMKVIEKTQEGYQPFDEQLREDIERKLRTEQEKARNQFFLDSLRNQATFQFNEQILSLPDTARVDDTVWCVIVNQLDTLRAKEARFELSTYALYTKAGQMSSGDKKDFFRTKSVWIMQVKLLQGLARKSGYFNAPEARQEERRWAQERARKAIRQQAAPPYNPTQEEIRQYFDSRPEFFTVEFPLHVYHIIFDDSVTVALVRDSILQGADFVERAKRQYPGQADIGEVAYDLGYISKYEMPEGFYEVANKLEVGEISSPFKTFLGYHLIKLIDRKKDKTIEEVSPQIIKTLKEEHQKKSQQEWEIGLKKGAKIKIFEKVLDQIDLSKLGADSSAAGSSKP